MNIDEIIERLHQDHAQLLKDLHRLQEAIEILDPPPLVIPKPAQEQIKEGILHTLQEYGPKTHNQLGRILGIPVTRAKLEADKMVIGGALESEQINTVTHYRIKREHLRIIAGDGVAS